MEKNVTNTLENHGNNVTRLIDAGAIENHLWNIHRFYGELPCVESDKLRQEIIKKCIGEIKKAPTVDAVPVVHGEWIWDGKKSAKCSICGEGIACKSEMMFTLAQEKEHFCYNCGAKMGKSENNHGN